MSFHSRRALVRCVLLSTAATFACGPSVAGSNVAVQFSVSDPDAAPFPSDRYTAVDPTQLSGRRIALPKPNCAVRVSDCQDIEVLNTLDGFSVTPRFTVPFTGDIDPATVTSDSVYLLHVGSPGELRAGARVGINQIAWDPPSRMLSFKSDELLLDHARYLLVVTNRVRDMQGRPIGRGEWLEEASGLAIGHRAESGSYRHELRRALALVAAGPGRPVAASLFTTQSATSELAQMAHQVKARTPSSVDFMVATRDGTPARALFDVADITRMVFRRQVGTSQFSEIEQPLASLQVVPGSVARVGYAYFSSPNYLTSTLQIPPMGTAIGTPQQRGETRLLLQVFAPGGAKPASGWPVVIFGHGFGDSLFGSPWSVASVLASYGLATASIHVMGHGGGTQGSLQATLASGATLTLPASGRGIDVNGDGAIAPTEGSTAPAPHGLIGARDTLRQTVVDLMQLARQFEAGVDIDGDGAADFDGRRISYSGQSFGGVYGTMLLGVERSLIAGVPVVGGGNLMEATRLGTLRSLRTSSLAGRTPSLINLPPLPGVPAPANLQFDENMPLRNEPPLVKHVPGAMAIAAVFERGEWAQQAGAAAAYAPLIRKRPLPGQAAKPIVFQMAKGDRTMPNPTSSLIVRAGDFADRVTYFRNDLAFAANPAVPKDPHGFMTGIGNPASRPHAIAAQRQIAEFLSSGGTRTVDPDGTQGVFEVPLLGPLPEGLNFIP
ncbi:hypothetical protein C7T35_16145 [Variovorax sp. WS11]|uniref:hypothetical protein n=1 Tax=Variovorax sp. WS11 TaxID=1105204 RepID=UPI000D0CC7BF|nr:hypothetical protein [Variovorax sp. WS11]NDZ18696.1 hypothetical protein [Variovorax sp. WS11]PSL83646.1 hypothetical protein C7T35_16145 [Variovorax sp. WS11]